MESMTSNSFPKAEDFFPEDEQYGIEESDWDSLQEYMESF